MNCTSPRSNTDRKSGDNYRNDSPLSTPSSSYYSEASSSASFVSSIFDTGPTNQSLISIRISDEEDNILIDDHLVSSPLDYNSPAELYYPSIQSRQSSLAEAILTPLKDTSAFWPSEFFPHQNEIFMPEKTALDEHHDGAFPEKNTAYEHSPFNTAIRSRTSPQRPYPLHRQSTSIDPITQVCDLTSEVRITHRYAVAHGGFSDIHRGEWIKQDTMSYDGYSETVEVVEVAVKLLRAFTRHEVDTKRARKRLNREVYVWKRLKHMNIAKFYGVSFQLGGRPALVMQWYKNGTAPNYIKTHANVDRLDMARHVAHGLQYLHTLDPPVVHGDLKGNNVLVSDDGQALLTDFGLSKILEELAGPTGNTTSVFAGSIRWQPPELLFDTDDNESDDESDDSSPVPTRAADIYSFGCTTYELITGNIPYHTRLHDWTVIQSVMKGISPVREDDKILFRNPGILQLLNDCWKPNPVERPDINEVVYRLMHLRLEGLDHSMPP